MYDLVLPPPIGAHWFPSSLAVINAETKAMFAPQFSVPLRRTRRELMNEIIKKYLKKVLKVLAINNVISCSLREGEC